MTPSRSSGESRFGINPGPLTKRGKVRLFSAGEQDCSPAVSVEAEDA